MAIVSKGRGKAYGEEAEEEEGELVSREAIDEDDEDEEELGQDEYEKDGFIVDEVEEDPEEEEVEERVEQEKQKRKKRRKSWKFDYVDEDDYELLEEHGIHRRRPKFKRLKKARNDFDIQEDHTELSDEEGPQLEDFAEEDADVLEQNEMADFIVSDEDDGIVIGGASIRPRKSRKKKLGEIAGVSTAAMEEARDIFGDVDELLRLRKKSLAESARSRDSAELQGKRLEDEFDPIILKEKYLTEKDDRIRKIDVPERIQISEEKTKPRLDEESIEEESSWILGQLPTNMIPFWFLKRVTEETNKGTSEESNALKYFKADIIRFLKLHHVEKYDIPFIVMYRKEQCLSLLKDPEEGEMENNEGEEIEGVPKMKWHKVLWAIKDLDTKWLLLQRRKRALYSNYNLRYEVEVHRIYDEARLNLNKKIFKSILKSIWSAESEREVDDVDMKFNLHFPPDEVEGEFKRPKRKSLYSMCSKAGLWEVASKFGWNSEQFGLQITLKEVMTEALEDLKETPEEIALNYKCEMFKTPEDVLKGARHMAAVEISFEPCLRKYVRSFFMDNAAVSTSPTSVGTKLIDSSHQLARVKWLHEKPLSKFEDAQWLLIQKAEEEKLLQVSITLPKTHLEKLTRQCNDYYLSDGVSKSARLWNEQRKLILQDAFSKFLLPSLEKEARVLLTAQAKKCLLMECGKQLWNKASVAPYQRKEHDVGLDEETAPRIMACCWGPGNPATTFVMLNSSGELLDWMYAGSLSRQSKNVDDLQCKKDQAQRLLKFMTDHQPHVIVLGAANLFCKRLKDEIYEIIYNMVEEYPRNVSQEMAEISIVYGDESLPRLYEHSQISSEQLPGQPGIVKRAVALGRFLQNPLAMIATLCGPGREILSWNLGSLEHFLTPDEKFEMVEQVMVDVTNQVGVDINLAASHNWLLAPLQFVSGLGPRKAGSLQRALVRAGVATSRMYLIAHGLGTKKVFANAIGFLRVRCSGLAASSSDFDLLDDTRIHPESYPLAEALASEVHTKYAETADYDETPIEYVKNNPQLLENFIVHNYAEDNNKDKRETLYDIKMELLHGFCEWRSPFKELSQDEEFYILSGENRDSLVEGKIVQVTVRHVKTDRAICVVDSGLTGILYKNEFADQLDDVDLTDKLQAGHVLACKIKQIQKNRYQLIITCKESELNNSQCQNSCDVDPYYREHQMHALSQLEKSCRAVVAKKNFIPRMIVHPHFRNMTADEAKEFLSDKDVGASVICPSSKGPSCLILTLKIYDGVYTQKEIVEDRKDQKASLLTLGTTLRIDKDSFEDLDEVMDRYVDPLVSHLKAILCYRKFRKGSKTEIDDLLKVEKSENPMRIVYCFGVCYIHPGAFILSFIRNTNPHHEYVVLHHKGYIFRKHTFHNIDRLVAYFQNHINDLPPQSTHSASAIVPMVGTAYRSCLGGVPMGGRREKNEINRRGQSCPERDTLSAPGSQGKNDSMSGGSQDRHPSGLTTKPHVEQSHCNYNSWRESNTNGGKGSEYGSTFQWGSDCTNGSGIENGWKNFPGAKIQNSPGREAFPGGWSDNQISSTSNGNWSGGDENVTKCSWGVKNIVGREGKSATANDAWAGGGKSSNTGVKDGKRNGNCLNKNSDTSGGRDWESGQRGSGIDSGGNWSKVSNDNWGRAGGNANDKESCGWGEWGGSRSGGSGTKDVGPRNEDWGDKSHGGRLNIDLGSKEGGRGTITSGNGSRVSNSWVDGRDGAATSLSSWAAGGNNDVKMSDDWGAWGDRKSGNSGANKGKGNDNWGNKKNTGWDGCAGGSKESGSDTVTSGNGCRVSNSWIDGRDGAATSLSSWVAGGNNDVQRSDDWGAWGDRKSGNSGVNKGKGNDNWGNKKNTGWDGCAGGSKESGSDTVTSGNGCRVSNSWVDGRDGAATGLSSWAAGGNNDVQRSDDWGAWGDRKSGNSGANKGKGNDSWGNKKNTGWDGCAGGSKESGSDTVTSSGNGCRVNNSWVDGRDGAATGLSSWVAGGNNDVKRSDDWGAWGDRKSGNSGANKGKGNDSWGNKKNTGWDGCAGGSKESGSDTVTSSGNGCRVNNSWVDGRDGAATGLSSWVAGGNNDVKRSDDWGAWGDRKSGNSGANKGKGNDSWGNKKNTGWDGCAGGSKESGSDTVTSSGNGCTVNNSWVDGRDGAATGLRSWAAGGNNDGKKSDYVGAWGESKSGNSGANKGKGNDNWGNKKNTGWDGCAGGSKESGKDTVTSGNVCTERNSRVDSRDGAATSLRSWASGSNNDGKKSDNWGSWEDRKSGNSGVKKGQGNDNWGNKKTNGWEGCDRGSRQSGSDVGTVNNRGGVSNAGWGDCKVGAYTNVGWGASGENVGKKSLGNENWGNKKTIGWEGCSRQSNSDAGVGNNAVGVSNASWGCKGGTSTKVGWGVGGENVGKKGQGNDNWSNKKTTGWDGCDRGSRQSGSDAGTVNIGGGVSNAGWGDCKGGAATSGGWGAVGENAGKKSGGTGEWGNKNNAGRGGGRAWHSAAEPGSEVKNASRGERSGNRGNKNNTRWDGSDSGSRPSGGGARTGDNGGGVRSGGWGNSKGGAVASGGWGTSGAKDGPKSGGWGEWGKKKSNAETDSKAKNAGWGANSGWK